MEDSADRDKDCINWSCTGWLKWNEASKVAIRWIVGKGLGNDDQNKQI